MDVRHNNNALKELNDCIGGLLHLGLNVITFRTLLHLGLNVITFRTLLHLEQLLHLGFQQPMPESLCLRKSAVWVRPRVNDRPRDSKFLGTVLTPLSSVQFAEVFFVVCQF